MRIKPASSMLKWAGKVRNKKRYPRYIWTKEEQASLDCNKIFVSLSLFWKLKCPASSLASQLLDLVNAKVNDKRIGDFLNQGHPGPGGEFEDQENPEKSENLKKSENPEESKNLEKSELLKTSPKIAINNSTLVLHTIVDIKNCNFSYDENSEQVLKTLTLSLNKPELVSVVGKIGSGKSSLLKSLLGDLVNNSFERFKLPEKAAYCSQEPWIGKGTLMSNVTWGDSYEKSNFSNDTDSTLYEDVIRSCQLTELQTTQINENGNNLSGGQKQRIAIARAVFRGDADLYLFDDVFSSLDRVVANSIFHDVFKNLLSGKICLLVTNDIEFIKQSDRILVVDDGRLVADGVYSEVESAMMNLEIKNFEKTMESVRDEVTTRYFEVAKPTGKSTITKNIKNSSDDTLFEKKTSKRSQIGLNTLLSYLSNIDRLWLIQSVETLSC